MKLPIWNSLSPRKRKLTLWAAGLLLAYAVIGFLILPPIVRSVAVKQLKAQLDREVSIEKIAINPFALSTSVNGLLIKDRDGQPFVSWDEVYVNFQLSSLFTRTLTFKEISTTQPYARVQLNWDGSFNFFDLVTKFSVTNDVPAPKKADAKPPVIRIGRLHIGGAKAAFADMTTREPFKRTIGPLDITLDDFRTDPSNKNPYAFSGTTDAGERISWSGHFYLDPIRSEGSLTLDHFTLNKYAPLYENFVRFQIRDGSIGVHLDYRFELSATNRVMQLKNTAFALRDFKLGLPGDSNNIVELPHFAVAGASVDLESRQATVDLISASDANLLLKRDQNQQVNLVEVSKPTEAAANPSGGIVLLLRSVTNAVTMLLQSTNQWSGTVNQVDITNCALHLEDLVNSRPARLDLTGIRLAAKNISNLPGKELSADFSLLWNTNGSIKTITTASFSPPTAEVHLDLDQLDLGTLDPYLEPKLNLFILGSKVGLHGRINLSTPAGELPQVAFRGDANLDSFRTVDGVMAEDLLKWDSLRFVGIKANLHPQSVAIKEIDVDNAYARLVIETNKSINLLNALRLTNAPATNEVKAIAKGSPTTNAPLPQISVGAIVLSNAVISFTDRSLMPDVNMAVQQVNGYVTGISTEPKEAAQVNLRAKVDGVGPVSITGFLNPLNNAPSNSIKISVKDVDLTPASPYSAKFAGLRIAQGKLNLDLAYDLVGKDLTAKNVIMLDHFSFGEKVESPDATKLPVRLAVAILKDREGKITLDVPIEGRTDDPQIRSGKVITYALLNILTKVATSPFSLVGALVGGGGEELGYQDFAPGSAMLTDDGKKKLDSLAKVLVERPALELEIAGSIDPDGDREGLQRAAIDKQIRTQLWMKLRKSEQATNSVDALVINPEERPRWVKKFYDAALADGKITPQLIAANTNLATFAAQVLTKKATIEKGVNQLRNLKPATEVTTNAAPAYQTKLLPPPDATEAVLLATYPVEAKDMEALAAVRVKAVQDYLLQAGQVAPGRLFPSTGTLRRDGSRAYLQFR